MDKKKLIFNYVLQIVSLAAIAMLFVPILQASGESMTVMELVIETGSWVYMEEYLFGIAGLISVICLPLLIISAELGKLSACGVIKNKKLDLALYIINIILASVVVGTLVNYFLGLGRTIGMSGLKLFQGETLFKFATAFFYVQTVLSIGLLVVSILNRKAKK